MWRIEARQGHVHLGHLVLPSDSSSRTLLLLFETCCQLSGPGQSTTIFLPNFSTRRRKIFPSPPPSLSLHEIHHAFFAHNFFINIRSCVQGGRNLFYSLSHFPFQERKQFSTIAFSTFVLPSIAFRSSKICFCFFFVTQRESHHRQQLPSRVSSYQNSMPIPFVSSQPQLPSSPPPIFNTGIYIITVHGRSISNHHHRPWITRRRVLTVS